MHTGQMGAARWTTVGLGAAALFLANAVCPATGMELEFPTENDALLTADPQSFYQYVDRNFEGRNSKTWEGGQYGFVRDPRRFGTEIIYTRFHEGIDIRPLHRSPGGEPQDVVGAIAGGQVVYVNAQPAASNYGRYVVVQHDWDGCPYFSLYAHLQTIAVQVGTRVGPKAPLGVLGYSGEGLNRERAHVHLELNLMLNAAFDAWYVRYFPSDPNRHGPYNGMNLDGIDLGRLYPDSQKQPALTVPEFLAREETWYRVRVPARSGMDILTRYPWLAPSGRPARAWEISFARSGVPLRFEPAADAPNAPVLTWVHPSQFQQGWLTRGYVQGVAPNCTLSKEGMRYLDLICPGD
ncbi:MAG TPA: M23 family metallopeptidase [Chthoniobacterales bacterium]